jgi:hypothetical protein
MEKNDNKKQVPQLQEAPWALRALGVVITACVAVLMFALTVRLCKWIIGS